MLRRIKIDKRVPSAGSGVKPLTEDWIDLSSNGTLTLAPDASLGFHDYSYDIAVGPKGDNIVFSQDIDGLYPTVGSAVNKIGGFTVGCGACSLRYDPTFEIVMKCGSLSAQYLIGLASEAIGDHGTKTDRENAHRGILFWNTTYYATRRGSAGVIALGTHTRIVGNYYRVLLDPEDGGRMEVYDLGAAPVDYNGGALVAAVSGYVNAGQQLLGGNVIAPYITPSNLAAWFTDRIVATRTTLRRP